MERLLLGSHMSISGGVHMAFDRGTRCGCATMQVFTKNSNRWEGPPVQQKDIENYKNAAAKSTISPVVAHAAYLINLCADDPRILHRSRQAFRDELERCEAFGILGVIIHPGSHLGRGEEIGLQRIAESLNIVHDETPGFHSLTILETTAGQGTALGYRFEHLRRVIDLLDQPSRAAVCVDTCHLYAAGYPIHTENGWRNTWTEFEQVLGFSRLAVVHVNDSRKPFGSRIDRHEHIGKGEMGVEPFRLLMNDPRFDAIPKILETDKSEDLHEDVENLTFLRSLRADHPMNPQPLQRTTSGAL
jgi:deoxyribonuclease-4